MHQGQKRKHILLVIKIPILPATSPFRANPQEEFKKFVTQILYCLYVKFYTTKRLILLKRKATEATKPTQVIAANAP